MLFVTSFIVKVVPPSPPGIEFSTNRCFVRTLARLRTLLHHLLDHVVASSKAGGVLSSSSSLASLTASSLSITFMDLCLIVSLQLSASLFPLGVAEFLELLVCSFCC